MHAGSYAAPRYRSLQEENTGGSAGSVEAPTSAQRIVLRSREDNRKISCVAHIHWYQTVPGARILLPSCLCPITRAFSCRAQNLMRRRHFPIAVPLPEPPILVTA